MLTDIYIAEGELIIRSRFVTKGYLQYDNSPFTHEDDGTVSFRTGDIYGHVAGQRLVWRGRKEDYVQARLFYFLSIFLCSYIYHPFQMSSGESLDPRVVEAILDQCPVVVRSCVVGNNFLRAPSQLVCAIIQPVKNASTLEITRAISVANRGLAPPLRISWSRVLVLKEDQEIPITKKGAIFRKKLEQLFGEQINSLLSSSDGGVASQSENKASASTNRAQGKTRDQIAAIVSNIVLQTLRISEETMDDNSQATFAEVSFYSSSGNFYYLNLFNSLEWTRPCRL